MLPRLPTALAVLAAVTVTGCDTDDSDLISGELGRGSFQYICVNDNDLVCASSFRFEGDAFPQTFAIGGRFWTRFDAEDGGEVPATETSAPVALSRDGSILRFERAGTVAVLAVRGNELVDYVHLDATPIARVRFVLAETQGITMAEVGVDREVSIEAIPRDADERDLAGTIDYQWTVADPAVAELVSAADGQEITLRGRQQGQTSLQVTAGELTVSLPVIVSEDAGTGTTSDPTTFGGSTGFDSTGDTGTGSTSGGTTG